MPAPAAASGELGERGQAPRARSTLPRSFKLLSALGVLGAAVLCANANVLVSRWYRRWDVTADRLYTLSPPTLRILESLEQPLEVTVLLAKSDPLSVSVRELLDAYRAHSQKLELRFVDPDQNPAEFQALQQKLGIVTGRAEDGRVLSDASIVVTRGERRHYITSDQIVRYDDDTGRARPRLEQALTEAIASVQSDEKSRVCFSTGHRELSLDDIGPEGLSEIRGRLEKSNFEVETRDLSEPRPELTGCQVLVVAGPGVAFGEAGQSAIVDFVQRGGSVFLLVGPLLGEDHRVMSSGLEPVAQLIGAKLGRDFVLETDAALRLPRGAGEIFFATPKPHPVTKGLEREGVKIDSRVLVTDAQSIALGADSPAHALLVSSERALSLHDLSALLDPDQKDRPPPEAPQGSYTLAVAAELPKPAGSQASHGPRLLVSGASNLIWGRNYRDASLYGNRLFVENALGWLAARAALVSVPEKREHEVGLSLSEESLGEVLRYVLIYMPGCAALLGVFVILRRRAAEKRSRQSAES